ncbi:histidine kinase [candidate division KSB1 bacterium]|nr:histidine kinase [candidate division KSB1 bacterium]
MSEEYSLFRKKFWIGIIVLYFTFTALMNIGIEITDELIYQKHIPIKYPIVHEFTGSYTLLFLIPGILWFFRKFPIQKKNWPQRFLMHLFATVVVGLMHTTLMTVARKILYPLFDLGVYNPGDYFYRYLMEYHKQFLAYWFFYGVHFLLKSIQENQRQKLRAVQLEQQITKARLQALQMQLNPHFLFNTLNMISATMYENVQAADKMLVNLSDLLRLTLRSMQSEEHPLENELALIQLYLEIMRARFGDKLSVDLNIAPETLMASVPFFMFQPIIENSIRYSMESLQPVKIEIFTRKVDDQMHIQVHDNGPGLNENKQISNVGVGLSNTIERLDKLYGTEQTFRLQNRPTGGLEVVIQIPFRLADKE